LGKKDWAMDEHIKRLCRSRDERIIWGICGGLGKYFEVDPVLIRVIRVVSIIFAGWSILAYLILRFVVPLEPR
jgi:phage shock protein PspC (stress-responsive transcriptional regulator)